MSRVQLTTNLPFEVRAALDKYVLSSGVPINKVVEDGVVWRVGGKGSLPADLDRALEAWCGKNKMNRGDVLELAVRRFLAQEAGDGQSDQH